MEPKVFVIQPFSTIPTSTKRTLSSRVKAMLEIEKGVLLVYESIENFSKINKADVLTSFSIEFIVNVIDSFFENITRDILNSTDFLFKNTKQNNMPNISSSNNN